MFKEKLNQIVASIESSGNSMAPAANTEPREDDSSDSDVIRPFA